MIKMFLGMHYLHVHMPSTHTKSCTGCNLRCYFSTLDCAIFLLFHQDLFFTRPCCTHSCACTAIWFVYQFQSWFWWRKSDFIDFVGTEYITVPVYEVFIFHLWRVFTAYFVFLCEGHEKFNFIDGRFIPLIILNKESKVGQTCFQIQKFIIKLSFTRGSVIHLVCTESYSFYWFKTFQR